MLDVRKRCSKQAPLTADSFDIFKQYLPRHLSQKLLDVKAAGTLAVILVSTSGLQEYLNCVYSECIELMRIYCISEPLCAAESFMSSLHHWAELRARPVSVADRA